MKAIVLGVVFSFYSVATSASVLVNLPLPAPQFPMGSTGYTLVATPVNGVVTLMIQTDQNFVLNGNQIVVATLSTNKTLSNEIPLSECSEQNCVYEMRGGQSLPFSEFSSAGSILAISFSVADLLNTPGGTPGRGHVSSDGVDQMVYVSFSIINPESTDSSAGENKATAEFELLIPSIL